MSWERYPNSNYPEPWDEADMVKATDVATNDAGTNLTVDAVAAGQGPLHVTADMVPSRTEEVVAEEETE